MMENWRRWGELPTSKFHYFELRRGYYWSACERMGFDRTYFQMAESMKNPPIERRCKLCQRKVQSSCQKVSE